MGDVEHCVNQLAGLIRDHALTDIVTRTAPPDMRVATKVRARNVPSA